MAVFDDFFNDSLWISLGSFLAHENIEGRVWFFFFKLAMQMYLGGPLIYLLFVWSHQGQIWNLLYLSQKWSDCHETKSKHIDRTLDLKCDHWVWPWPWPRPWIFKVKYGICYISAKNGPIATKQKANISIELKASNVTMGFDLGHDLDLEFSRSNMEFATSQPKWSDCHETKTKHIVWTQGLKCDHGVWPWPWPWPWIFMVKCEICYISIKSDPKVRCKDLQDSDRGDFSSSDVGVPSTHLVCLRFYWNLPGANEF